MSDWKICFLRILTCLAAFNCVVYQEVSSVPVNFYIIVIACDKFVSSEGLYFSLATKLHDPCGRNSIRNL